jgi:uncharacterized membrane protein
LLAALRPGWERWPVPSVGLLEHFGGYHARVGLVRALRVPDFAIAIPEDLIAIGLGLFLASRF